MENDYEEIEIVADDSFESICNSICHRKSPAACFGASAIILNSRASSLVDFSFCMVKKNDKYIVLLPKRYGQTDAYKLIRAGKSNPCYYIWASKGYSSGFYSGLRGKRFKVKKIKGGGLAICLQEEII